MKINRITNLNCLDYLNNVPEIIVSSTQEYISNLVPDTMYINIL